MPLEYVRWGRVPEEAVLSPRETALLPKVCDDWPWLVPLNRGAGVGVAEGGRQARLSHCLGTSPLMNVPTHPSWRSFPEPSLILF